jgi:hypothetical protein
MMNLRDAILENQNYVDPDEGMYVVFARKLITLLSLLLKYFTVDASRF